MQPNAGCALFHSTHDRRLPAQNAPASAVMHLALDYLKTHTISQFGGIERLPGECAVIPDSEQHSLPQHIRHLVHSDLHHL